MKAHKARECVPTAHAIELFTNDKTISARYCSDLQEDSRRIERVKFEEKVWELLKKIPRGKVTTYGLIARKLNTKAYRAVGNACRRNPYAPIVPCHRVVRSDGTVGGFGGKTSGKWIKKKIKLLRKENVEVRNRRIVDFERVLFSF